MQPFAPELSLALAAFDPAMGVRAQVELARHLGARAVHLSARAPDARPRDLGRSARRDLAALLRRNELRCSGIDLWIPPAHLADATRVDRALAALEAALGLARELADLTDGDGVLSTKLPAPGGAAAGAVDRLEDAAARLGARIADHAWPPCDRDAAAPIGVGIDPAAVLLAGEDPARAASRAGATLVSARLSDAADAGRVEPGVGRLDELAYVVALATAAHAGPLVLDLRGVRDPITAARRTLERTLPDAPA